MGTYLTPKCLDQAGLILGFIAGMLLIPEVFNRIPAEKFEHWLERQLHRTEQLAGYPTRYSLPSWKLTLTPEERVAAELPTALASLILSIVWITLLVIGLRFRITVLLCLAVGIVIIFAVRNVSRIHRLWPRLPLITLLMMFLAGLGLLVVVTPVVSLIRIVMLILRAAVGRTHRFLTTHRVLRNALTGFAIFAFILSNVLQFLATLL